MINLYRLITGEDILAESPPGFHVDADRFVLSNPVVVVAMPPGKPGQPPNIGFAPWLPYSKDRNISIAKEHIVTITEPLPEFVTQYKAIHSKLDLPLPGKLIIPGT